MVTENLDDDLNDEIDLSKLPIVARGRYAPERLSQFADSIPPQFIVAIDGDLYRLIKDRAAQEHRSISEMVNILLQRELTP